MFRREFAPAAPQAEAACVARILRPTAPAPELVETVLAGPERGDLSLRRLCGDLPLDWVAQRRRLAYGFGRTGPRQGQSPP